MKRLTLAVLLGISLFSCKKGGKMEINPDSAPIDSTFIKHNDSVQAENRRIDSLRKGVYEILTPSIWVSDTSIPHQKIEFITDSVRFYFETSLLNTKSFKSYQSLGVNTKGPSDTIELFIHINAVTVPLQGTISTYNRLYFWFDKGVLVGKIVKWSNSINSTNPQWFIKRK